MVAEEEKGGTEEAEHRSFKDICAFGITIEPAGIVQCKWSYSGGYYRVIGESPRGLKKTEEFNSGSTFGYISRRLKNNQATPLVSI